MVLVVHVGLDGPDRPPAGAPVLVQVQDVTMADARAVTVAEATGSIRGEEGGRLATVELALEQAPAGAIVRVHVDVDGSGRVSRGDFITMESYPVPRAERATLEVAVRKV